jgi:nucleotidyltransferase substrate binding protein (TIGR01987 family)
MAQPQLDLSSFKKASRSLLKAIQQPKDEFIRDSVIQRFEFTFELAWKTLKRYFEWNQKLSESNVKNIFREAGTQGLITSVEKWFTYLQARNETSHTYDEVKAEEIYLIAKEFSKDCELLIKKLEPLVN